MVLCVQAPEPARAERNGSSCYVKEEKGGPDVLELYAATDFYALPYQTLHQKIWLDCWVQTAKLYDGIRLQAKTRLYNAHLKVIAKVLQPFNPMQLLEQKDSMTHIQVSGLIDNICIDAGFVPETDLDRLLLHATENAKLGYFKDYLARYNYQCQAENNNYTSYVVYEPEFTRITLQPRILMIFYKDELIAIFHTRKINVKLYDSIEMGSEYKMIYNSKFAEHTKKEMVAIYKNKLNQKKY